VDWLDAGGEAENGAQRDGEKLLHCDSFRRLAPMRHGPTECFTAAALSAHGTEVSSDAALSLAGAPHPA
jgi:hypothetical protein